jgi:hypothetical protein
MCVDNAQMRRSECYNTKRRDQWVSDTKQDQNNGKRCCAEHAASIVVRLRANNQVWVLLALVTPQVVGSWVANIVTPGL